MNPTEKWLEANFEEVWADEFYRDVFPEGELDEADSFTPGKYIAIALCISQTEKRWSEKRQRYLPKIYRFSMTDELDLVSELTARDDLFCLMSPISYAGKSRTAENARIAYGITVDVDNLIVEPDGTPIGIRSLWNAQVIRVKCLPKPTYIVSSGTGVHLYYLFEKPVPLFKNVAEQLQRLKHELTFLLWDGFIVDIKHLDEIQYEGIYQGFRMVGTITKDGGRARAFKTGERVSVEYLNQFVSEKNRVTEFAYKSNLTLAQAEQQYPEWYQERIVDGKKGVLHPWAIRRSLYDWWKSEIISKGNVGHRYYCMMLLAVYAKKCSFYDPKKNPNPVTFEELTEDAFEIMVHFERKTAKDDNHFTESDVLDALDAFDHGMITFPRNSVEYRAGFALPQRKRNYRKQDVHLRIARSTRDILRTLQGKDWREGNGRPAGSKDKQPRKTGSGRPAGSTDKTPRKAGGGRPAMRQRVLDYIQEHPGATVSEVAAALQVSRPTVYKWRSKEETK